jgi:hypothetical protein
MSGERESHTQVPSNLVAKFDFEFAEVFIGDRELEEDSIVAVDIVY